MAILGVNSIINQYIPTFLITNVVDGQTLVYNSTTQSFVNSSITSGTGATKLGQLLDVSSYVDNPLSVKNGQALIYDSTNLIWQNEYIDYNSLINLPTSSNYSFIGLSDTTKPSTPNAYVQWNSAGTELIYSTTIPSTDVVGLGLVAYSNNYNDLNNKPTSSSYSYSFLNLTDVSTPALANSYLLWNSTGTELIYSTTIPSTKITGLATVAIDGTLGSLNNVSPTADTLNNTSNAGEVLQWTGSVWQPNVISAGSISGLATVARTGSFTDLINKPTSASYQFIGLSDTAKPSTPNAYVQWNSAGTELIYSTTIPSTDVVGLGLVAYSNNYNDLSNKPTITNGTVTSVSVVSTDGIAGSVINASTTPQITLSLGAITPTSVNASGTIIGSNLHGTNTGDQTITLTGDVAGIGTGTITTSLAIVNSSPGTYSRPIITVDSKGRVISASTGPLDVTSFNTRTGTVVLTSSDVTTALGYVPGTGAGSVTSVSASGNNGITIAGSPITTVGVLTFGLGAITPASVVSTGNIIGANLSGSNTGDQTISISGDISAPGSRGNLIATLALTGVTPGTYTYPIINVDNKGRITSATSQLAVSTFNTRSGTVVLTSSDVTTALGYVPGTGNGNGSVTSITTVGNGGILISGSPITTSGTLTFNLGAITPTSINSTGSITGSNLHGTNTGDQTIILSGDVTGTGTGSIVATLASVNTNVGTFGSTTSVPQITVDAKGRITSVGNVSIGVGTVTSITATGSNGIIITGSPITSAGTLAFSLGAITPTSIVASGTITGSNISGTTSGTNTGDQTITASGDATGVSTDVAGATSLSLTLSTVNSTPGVFGDPEDIPVVTINSKGLVTSITTVPVDTTVSDYIPSTETLTILQHRQYILTGQLQLFGNIINNGRIAIL